MVSVIDGFHCIVRLVYIDCLPIVKLVRFWGVDGEDKMFSPPPDAGNWWMYARINDCFVIVSKQWWSEGRVWLGTCPPKAPCSSRSCQSEDSCKHQLVVVTEVAGGCSKFCSACFNILTVFGCVLGLLLCMWAYHFLDPFRMNLRIGLQLVGL